MSDLNGNFFRRTGQYCRMPEGASLLPNNDVPYGILQYCPVLGKNCVSTYSSSAND